MPKKFLWQDWKWKEENTFIEGNISEKRRKEKNKVEVEKKKGTIKGKRKKWTGDVSNELIRRKGRRGYKREDLRNKDGVGNKRQM